MVIRILNNTDRRIIMNMLLERAAAKRTPAALLKRLATDWGFNDPLDMLQETVMDNISPGICPDCFYSTEVEPDQDKGWCEECESGTVKSALILAGII